MKKYRFILFVSFLLTGGCSDGGDKAAAEQSGKEHFMKAQAQALEKSREVEQMLQDEADKLRQAIDEQSE